MIVTENLLAVAEQSVPKPNGWVSGKALFEWCRANLGLDVSYSTFLRYRATASIRNLGFEPDPIGHFRRLAERLLRGRSKAQPAFKHQKWKHLCPPEHNESTPKDRAS